MKNRLILFFSVLMVVIMCGGCGNTDTSQTNTQSDVERKGLGISADDFMKLFSYDDRMTLSVTDVKKDDDYILKTIYTITSVNKVYNSFKELEPWTGILILTENVDTHELETLAVTGNIISKTLEGGSTIVEPDREFLYMVTKVMMILDEDINTENGKLEEFYNKYNLVSEAPNISIYNDDGKIYTKYDRKDTIQCFFWAPSVKR